MAENIERNIGDWQARYDYERHRAPARELSPEVDRDFEWLPSNREHKIPIDWLTHYARCFHFSDAEILAARKTGHMPRASGVYFLFRDDQCFYVGQTQNFFDRHEQHQRNGVEWTSHTYFEVPKFFAPDVEAYYIHRIRPQFNLSYPPSNFYSGIVKKLGLDLLNHT
jgi:hypothetical protein